MRIRWVLLLVFGLLTAGATAFAQVSSSRIVGTVTDASGAVVPGAKVIATNEATGITYETTTTESGAYSFTALQVGNYSITVEATGFKKWIGTKNELNVGSPLVLNTALEVGEITSTVQVESSYERLKTSDAMISDVVDRRAIRDLPLNGRNPLNLITLQPGLIQRSTGGAGSGTHINGSRDRAFNITLDGIDANEPSVPNPQSNVFRLNTDNVQEYRIVTHNATAEFGRSSGANVALASRAGTNEIHGNLFEYFRNPVLNAKDFFVNLQNQDKPDFKIHQFGADVGGPVIKNKTFWFASWQSQRLGFTQPIQEIFGNPTVYTATARMGIYRFVRGTVTLPDGTTRSSNSTALVDSQGNLLPGIATCGGSVTTNCVDRYNITTNTPGFGLDPVMGTYIGDMPLPNNFSASGDGLNTAAFLWNPPSSQPELRFLFRVDHQFDENNSVFGRYTWANADTKGGDFLNARPQVFPGYPPLGLVNRRPRNLALSYRRVFSPRLVNEFTAGYSRFLFDFLFGRANPDFPNIVPFVSGVISEPFLNQSGTARWLTTIQYIDNLSYTTGNHLFRGGINFRFVRHNDERSFVGAVNNAPNVTFASTRIDATTFGLPATGTGGINGTDQTRLRNMMSDMLGLPASITQFYFTSGVFDYTPSGLYIRGVRYHQFNYYAQDEWKLRPNLTFSLGLRWEWNRPATEANDLILRPDKPLDGSQGLVTFAQRDTFWDRQNANSLAPRIGIAWDPFAKGKSVIRGGYSVLYDVISTFQMVPVLGLVPGSSARCSVSIGSSGVPVPSANCSAPAGSGSTIAGGFPLSLPSPTVPPSNFTTPPITQASLAPPTGAIDPDLQNPTVHEWTLNVQHDLGKSVILQVGYLGKRGTHLFDAYDLNQVKLPSSFLSAFSVARNNLVIGCDADGTVAGSSTAPCAIAGGAVPTLLNQMLCRTATTANNFNCSNTNNSAVTGRLISNAAGSLADLIDTGTSFTGTVSNPNNTFDNMRTVMGQANFFRSNPQFDSIFYFDNSTDSYYHALQIQLRRQANNLGFGASYTFGKSIDNGSTDPVGATSGGAIGNASTSTTDIRNFRVDRGRSDFDRTHSFVGHVVYDLPFGRGQKYAADVPGWLNQLVGGWTGTSIVTITSGEPWSALSGQLTNSNIRGSRVDILQNPPTGVFHNVSGVVGPTVFPESVLQNLDQFFAIPAPGTNGNSGRNIFTGPSYWNVDLGVTKRFTITERINLQFRAEFFNAFNHANFDNPLTSTSGVTTVFNANDTDFQDPNPNFARVCCASVSTPSTTSLISVGEAARVIQFALRVNF